MKQLPELLCPAGDKESFYAAVNNGADAVYLGGKLFNARAQAGNFSDDDFDEILDYAHLRGVKVHLTLNTLYRNSEVKDVLHFAEQMYIKGVDAFILQDMGVAAELRRNFKDIKLNASTQMSIHSLEGVKYAESLGFDRVVLARELSLKEINEISANTNIEIEAFVHGALCVSYSGQCLMSSLIGGRSGNRGKCAQTCRMYYSLLKNSEKIMDGYLLSPRDIMTLEVLKDLTEAGINSFKVEGRMKNPEYVAIVTKAYREAMDGIKSGADFSDENAVKEVMQAFNRGGHSTTGYYYDFAGAKMMSTLTPKSTGLYLGKVVEYRQGKRPKCVILLEDSVVPGDGIEIWTDSKNHAGAYVNKEGNKGDILEVFVEGSIKRGDKVYKSFDKALSDKGKRLTKQSKKQLEIEGTFKALLNQPMELTLQYGNIVLREKGDNAILAESRPITEDDVLEQLSKTGNTPYRISFKTVEIADNLFINRTALNNLRRQAIEKFEKMHLASYKRVSAADFNTEFECVYAGQKKLTVKVRTEEQFIGAVHKGVSRIYYPAGEVSDMKRLSLIAASEKCDFYVYFPSIDRTESEGLTEKSIASLEEVKEILGYLVSTHGQLRLAQKSTKNIALDYTFNIFNSLSRNFYSREGTTAALSMELNLKDMQQITGENTELIIHGNQTVMSTHQCPVGLYAGEKEKGKYCKYKNSKDRYYLLDRKNEKFEIIRNCDLCTAFILNSQKLAMSNKITDLLNANAEYLRLNFVTEEKEEVSDTILKYKAAIQNNEDFIFQQEGLTYGHFYRGAE